MKTSAHDLKPRAGLPGALLLFSFFIFHFSFPARGVLSEPPNLLFGTIRLNGVLADSNRTDLVIEARRASDNLLVTSYRLGTTLQYDEFYLLEIPVETPPATNQPGAVITNTALKLVLRDEVSALAQLPYTVLDRGRAQRLDFVVESAPDPNGLPDEWELSGLGATGQDPNGDPDQDGRSNLQEYIAGTNPLLADGGDLSITRSNAMLLVSFVARKAEGAGYSGRTRYFTLEAAAHLASTEWQPVRAYTNIVGTNQTVVFVTPGTNRPARFYRTTITLPGN